MKFHLPTKAKLRLHYCLLAAVAIAFLFSLPTLYYSDPKYEVEPELTLYLFVPFFLFISIIFMAFASLAWGCSEELVWLIMKYHPFTYCWKYVKGIPKMLHKDWIKHLILHILLLLGNSKVQLIVNGLHSVKYHFSISPQVRMFDTLVCYLIMLLFVYVYQKLTRCDTKSIFYYAVIGVLPCIFTALVLEWHEFAMYEQNYCSDY